MHMSDVVSAHKQQGETPIGVIVEVHGPVVVVACDTLPPLRQALCAGLDHQTAMIARPCNLLRQEEIIEEIEIILLNAAGLDSTPGAREQAGLKSQAPMSGRTHRPLSAAYD